MARGKTERKTTWLSRREAIVIAGFVCGLASAALIAGQASPPAAGATDRA